MTIKIDFGSGYNPLPGYKKCDITNSPSLDYFFDLNIYRIINCEDNSVDEICCKNVLHHVRDIRRLFFEFRRILRPGKILKIVEPTREAFPANVFLDFLWYRGIIYRPEVWFSNVYRNYHKDLEEIVGSHIIMRIEEKETTICLRR
jgi:ubiquinone/menaquinone biosynthesis C-methylase UbiE